MISCGVYATTTAIEPMAPNRDAFSVRLTASFPLTQLFKPKPLLTQNTILNTPFLLMNNPNLLEPLKGDAHGENTLCSHNL